MEGSVLRLISIILLSFFAAISAFAGTVTSVDLTVVSASEARIAVTGAEFDKNHITVFEISGESPRIVIDIVDGSSPMLTNGAYHRDMSQGIKSVRGAVKDSSAVRFVLDLKPGSGLQSYSVAQGQISIILS